MSRIGKLPIALEKGVKATLADGILKARRTQGQARDQVHPGFMFDITDGQIDGEAAGRRARTSAPSTV